MKFFSKKKPTGVFHEQINHELSAFQHPTLKKSLSVLRALRHTKIVNNTLHIELVLPFAWRGGFAKLREHSSATLLQLTGAEEINYNLTHNIATMKPVKNMSGVRNLIAISSGKGGVGKSSTAVNLALALMQEGGRVGLLDADIYGPSIPTMLGTAHKKITSPDGHSMVPIMVYGLATNSVGYMIKRNDAVVWRGPMASKALLQLLTNTLWPELDYLILDMPPGTGDIQLTLAKNIPVTAALVVTTPQDIALDGARKGIAMFEKTGVPVLGIIENMNMHICSHCGHSEAIFGSGGAAALAEECQCTLLGQLPLHISLRQDLDRGKPTVASAPQSAITKIYRQLAGLVAAQLYWKYETNLSEIEIKPAQ